MSRARTITKRTCVANAYSGKKISTLNNLRNRLGKVPNLKQTNEQTKVWNIRHIYELFFFDFEYSTVPSRCVLITSLQRRQLQNS